jgi:multiple sugar transport system permease protein
MATTTVGRPATARTARVKPRRLRLKGETRAALLFLLPSFIGFVVFYAIPALRGFYLSFTDFNLLRNSGEWVGLRNYQGLLSDSLFWNSLWITFKYVIINTDEVKEVAADLDDMWMWMLDPSLGIINHWLDAIGIGSQGFLGSESQVIPTIAGINIWRNMGYTALLLFGGLVMIPKSYYEAAALDGASEWRMFRTITLPLLRPVLALVLVVTVIGSFQVFDTVQIATGGIGGAPGGPGNSSRVLYLYIFQQAFEFNDLGYASALAVALIVLLVFVAAFQLKMLRAGESDLA